MIYKVFVTRKDILLSFVRNTLAVSPRMAGLIIVIGPLMTWLNWIPVPVVYVLCALVFLIGGCIRTYMWLSASRLQTALAFSMDDEYLYIDRSLVTVGRKVQRIPLSDVRRLVIHSDKSLTPDGQRPWWSFFRYEDFRVVSRRGARGQGTYAGRHSTFGLLTPLITLDYQDRIAKILYRPIGVSLDMNGVDEFIERVLDIPGLTFRIVTIDVSAEIWLEEYHKVKAYSDGDPMLVRKHDMLDMSI